MSTGQAFGNYVTRTVTMDSDLSAKAGYAVNLDATDDNNVDLASAATAVPFVLMEGVDGSSAKANGTIALSGRVVLKLGGTVAPGDKLTANASGEWIKTTTDTNHYGAVALQIGVDGDEIEAWVVQGMVAG